MFTLIEGGELYAPEALGVRPILLSSGRIARIGEAGQDGAARWAAALDQLDLPWRRIDAGGCIVTPGLIDPHAHLIGAGGEQGFGSREPEMSWQQLAAAGITTVVGCLGTDAIGRSLGSLLCKARELEEKTQSGLTTMIYTGSFQVPPPTLTGSVTSDLVLIDKVTGVGEIAIADVRSSQPTLEALAGIVSAAYVGGRISGKAGVCHFHTGPSQQRLEMLHQLLDRFDIHPEQIYPTHVSRTRELMDDAIRLAQRGCFVDTDTVDEGTARWIRYYLERGGPGSRLSLSSDSHTPGGSPKRFHDELVAAIQVHEVPVEQVLRHFSTNAADALRLQGKGRLREGGDADLLLLERRSLEVMQVMGRGRLLIEGGQPVERDDFPDNSSLIEGSRR